MQLYDVADYTGDAAAHTLASLLGFSAGNAARAKWFQITVVTGTSSTVPRIGSSSITATRGIPISGSQFAPPIAANVDFYDLTRIYLQVDSGDVVSIAYAI